jgi:hypothetical protein
MTVVTPTEEQQAVPGSTATTTVTVNVTTQVPGKSTTQLVKEYWDSLTTASSEATNYKPQAQRQAEAAASQAALKASAAQKLATLGLSPAEIAAIIGA